MARNYEKNGQDVESGILCVNNEIEAKIGRVQLFRKGLRKF